MATQVTLNSGSVDSAGSLALKTNGTTTAVTIDTAQNMGLGVTPSAWGVGSALDVGAQTSVHFSSSVGTMFSKNTYFNSGYKYRTTSTARAYVQDDGGHSWLTAASGTAGNTISFTQAMTLDASGNLGIGTSSPSQKLHISGNTLIPITNTYHCYTTDYGMGTPDSVGLQIFTAASDSIRFGHRTSGTFTERARITSGGDLLVGTTSTVNSARETVSFQSSSGGTGISFIDAQANNTASFAAFYSNVTKIGSITNNGNSAVLYNVTSDQRLKKNIVDAPEFGGIIDSIKVRSYDWIANETHQRAGFIAQELVTIAPEAVHQPTDADEMMAVDYSKLVPMLVKEIQSLRVRVAQLESN